jgi:phosphoribosylformylglycinamidine cyclo-ligase
MNDYASAGVDVAKGDDVVRRLKKHVESTYTKEVLRGMGSFAGAIDASALKTYKEPVLLSTIDGVGTKTAVAARAGRWEGIGHDIVNHSGNDLVCQGATPLFFLDYIASAILEPEVIETIVRGMSEACKELGCVLIGGETAEMPQVYAENAVDVAGTMIGVAEKSKMITGENITEGDLLIALSSNGLHTNGYSLARKVLLEKAQMDIHSVVVETPERTSLADALLVPHTSYVKTVLKLHSEAGLKGAAHITGGGIAGNLSRILPQGLGAKIEKSAINVPPIFELIQKTGNVSGEAMYEAFNMGVGMVLVAEKELGEGYLIGRVTKEQGIRFS